MGGLFLSSLFFYDCHIHFFTTEDHISCWIAEAAKTFHHVILNTYVQTSSARLYFVEGELPELWRPCRGPRSFNSSFNSTSSAHVLTLLKQSHIRHLPLHQTNLLIMWEFLDTGRCKYFKYLNFDYGT